MTPELETILKWSGLYTKGGPDGRYLFWHIVEGVWGRESTQYRRLNGPRIPNSTWVTIASRLSSSEQALLFDAILVARLKK